jgi:hypothetical protein
VACVVAALFTESGVFAKAKVGLELERLLRRGSSNLFFCVCLALELSRLVLCSLLAVSVC